jgi:hypothetical protein
MYRMQSLERLLERRAELVEQSSLACIDRVSAIRWGFEHTKKCV